MTLKGVILWPLFSIFALSRRHSALGSNRLRKLGCLKLYHTISENTQRIYFWKYDSWSPTCASPIIFALPGQQQQQQQLGWFSVRNMLIPLNVETTTTAMPTPTSTFLASHGDDDIAGIYLIRVIKQNWYLAFNALSCELIIFTFHSPGGVTCAHGYSSNEHGLVQTYSPEL